jgi:very-short-patch-repair endonuclease
MSSAVDSEIERSQDRALRLFEYLRRLAELRTAPVRDVNEYAQVLWFDRLPREPECQVVTTGQPLGAFDWVVVDRPEAPSRPRLPPNLAQWVDEAELDDPAADPQLRAAAELGTRVHGADGAEVERRELRILDQHPEVSAAWRQYRVNEEEARAVVEQVAKCCADPAYDGASMGVASLLGEAQAMRIRDLLVERVGPDEMVARRIKCGDAYAFQGDERQVMFLSMVVAPAEDGRRLPARTQKGDRQRFNVAASRAQNQLWLFHSVQPENLNPDCVRASLLGHFLNPPPALDAPEVAGEVRPDVLCEPFDSLFEQRVYLRIRARGYEVVPQQRVHGYRIDLVVFGEGSRLAVECDGDAWHGPERYEQDMARQRDLERCGWRFFRVRASEFNRDPDAALAPLWTQLAEREIWPSRAAPRAEEQTPVA